MSNKGMISALLIALVAGFFAFGSVEKVSADVFAKENKADALYGKGVHAFYDGDYREAIRLLDQAEELGSEDPRAYYFLGLACFRRGLTEKADSFFQKAANLEWSGKSFRDYNVSGALRRIQGKERILIEKHRNQAKADWMKTEKRRQTELYKKELTEEKDVLKTMAESFVGAAPFGARSVHPFRSAEDKKEDKVISVEDELPIATSVTAKPKTEKTSDAVEETAAKMTIETVSEEVAEEVSEKAPKKVSEKAAEETAEKTPAMSSEDDEEDDPFADTNSKPKKEAEPKKESEKKDSDLGDDPFGTSDEPKKDENKKEEPAEDEDDDDPFA